MFTQYFAQISYRRRLKRLFHPSNPCQRKMSEAIVIFDPYEIPSNKIRRNRKFFYGLKKKRDESIEIWFNCVRSSIDGCEFAKLGEILLVDKFFSEIDNNELKSFKNAKTWSLKQLNEYFVGHEIDTVWVNSGDGSNENETDVRQRGQESQSDAVKCEIVSILKIYKFKFKL